MVSSPPNKVYPNRLHCDGVVIDRVTFIAETASRMVATVNGDDPEYAVGVAEALYRELCDRYHDGDE